MLVIVSLTSFVKGEAMVRSQARVSLPMSMPCRSNALAPIRKTFISILPSKFAILINVDGKTLHDSSWFKRVLRPGHIKL